MSEGSRDPSESCFILLEQIFFRLGYSKEEANKWKKILEDNLYDTLDSIDNLTTEDWEAMNIPFNVLIEFRKRYIPRRKFISKLTKHNPVTFEAGRRHSSFETTKANNDIEQQSFRDLSQFIKVSHRASSEDFKKKKWKLRVKKSDPNPQKLIVAVNIVGREGHSFNLIQSLFGENTKPQSSYNIHVSIYGHEIGIQMYDCTVLASESPEVMIVVFSREDIQSLDKMLEKWIKTKEKEKQKIPILLVGIDTNKKSFKQVQMDVALEALREFNGIRYFEVASPEDTKEILLEIARIKVRSLEVQPKDISFKIQKAVDKKISDVAFRKKGISLLPNSIYSISSFTQKLRLESNNFKYFPTELLVFQNLQELNLAFNQIEEIPSEIAQLVNLQKLDLESNLLEYLPIHSFQSMKNLVELRVKGNPLSRLPDELKGKGNEILLSIRSFIPKDENDVDTKVFGVPLFSLLRDEKKLYQLKNIPLLPKIAVESINFLFKFGVQVDGIFRIAGQNVRCMALKDEIDSGNIKFSDSENPHDIANVFKQWLRELPEPLFLYSNFDSIISLASKPEDEKISGLMEIISSLPPENYSLVKQIFRLMFIVSMNSEVNRMDASNITKVVTPNLIYSEIPSQDPFKTMSDFTSINDVLEILTSHYPTFFEKDFHHLSVDPLIPDPIIAVFHRRTFGHSKSIMATSLSSDSKIFWSADSRGMLKLWNSDTLSLITTIDTNKRRINCLINYLQKMFVGTIDGVEVRDESTGEHIRNLSSSAAFTITAANSHLWIGDSTKILLFNCEDYSESSISVSSEPLTLISFDSQVWGACRDNKIRCWNAKDFQLEKEFDSNHESKISSIAGINDTIWSWDNAKVFIWDKEGNKIGTLEKHHLKIFGAKTILDRAWTFSWKGDIHTYNPSTFEYCGEIYTYHTDAISSIEIIDDPELKYQIVFTASWDKSIICWHISKNDKDLKKKRKHRKKVPAYLTLPLPYHARNCNLITDA